MRTFRDILISCAAGLAALVLLELGLRIDGVKFPASLYEPDPYTLNRLRPNAEGWEVKEGENYVKINSRGMRDVERNPDASPNVIRVAVIGDSLVAAQQVPLERTMTQLLERKLTAYYRTSDVRVEVLNFGTGGTTIAQEYLRLSKSVWRFHPNIVIVFIGGVPYCVPSMHTLSGPTPFYSFDDGGRLIIDPKQRWPKPEYNRPDRLHALFGNLHNRFRVLQVGWYAFQQGVPRLLIDLHLRPRPKFETAHDFMEYWAFRPPQTPEMEKAWKIAEALTGAMIDDANAHGAEFWLGLFGHPIEDNPLPAERAAFMQTYGISSFDYAANRFAALAQKRGVAFFRPSPLLRLYSEEHSNIPMRGFFNTKPYFGHYNQTGNAAVAELLGDDLIRNSRTLHQHERSAMASGAPSAQ
jgi:hypothetical protein